MFQFTSFAQGAAHCLKLAAVMHEADEVALEKATALLLKKVKEKFGKYQPSAGEFVAWAELAESTKQDRQQQGYSEDEPLLRSGGLRDDVQRSYDAHEGRVGSNNDTAVYQELGTKRIPPRSTFGSAAVENLDAIYKIVGEEAFMALVGAQVFQGAIGIEEWSK